MADREMKLADYQMTFTVDTSADDEPCDMNMAKGLRRYGVKLVDQCFMTLWWLRARLDPEGTRRWIKFLKGAAVMAHVHGSRP